MLVGPIAKRCEQVLRQVANKYRAEIMALEIMPDHVHVLVEVDPQLGIHRLVKHLKGVSSHTLRQEFRTWSGFIRKLSYKAESAGRWLVKVNARGTSQQCPCGRAVPKKLWDRKHHCSACGFKTIRDHASALEILRRGLCLRTETPALAGVALEAPSFSYGE